jgi:hypothetical protein
MRILYFAARIILYTVRGISWFFGAIILGAVRRTR